VELLQIHLMTVHITNGVANPSEIIQRIGAQIQKRKIAPTPPENFDSITILLKISLFLRYFRVPHTHRERKLCLSIRKCRCKICSQNWCFGI